jgi:thioredoxin reductase (NADPH)
MNRPQLLIVSHDLDTQQHLAETVRLRFAAHYDITTATSSMRAIDLLTSGFASCPVVMVIADAYLPELDGIALLQRAHRLHSDAARLLLIDVGDMSIMDTLHRAMALNQIDGYLLRPAWQWPEEWLYPQLQESLTGWARTHGPHFEAVQIVGEQWSARCHELRDLLTRNIVPYGFYASDSEAGRWRLHQHGMDDARLPVLILHNGTTLEDPCNAEVAAALGARTRPDAELYDVAIVGAGPAGLAAAVYGASEGLRTVVLEHEAIGGQAGTSAMIRNYLGFPRGVSGSDLTARAVEQALNFGAEFIYTSQAVAYARAEQHHVLRLHDDSELACRSVIIATGVSYRRLGVSSLEALMGAGVFYGAALAEAPALVGQKVFIVGGGNSAGQAALHLAKFAARVWLLVRGESLAVSMSDYLIKQMTHHPGIEVCLTTRVVEGWGEDRLEGLVLENSRSGRREALPADALFVMIGATPHTDWVGAEVQRDRTGYLRTGRDLDMQGWPLERAPLPLETSAPGVFAVGDVRANSTKRVASAVGEGSVAIRLIHEYFTQSMHARDSEVDPLQETRSAETP